MINICIVTAARSEYGLLRWILQDLENDSFFNLQLVVTGGHLSPEQGLTYKFIEDDGFHIDRKIEILFASNSSVGIAKSMGVCGLSISDVFYELNPTCILVLGDRYELLPICSAALVMNIPIIHLSGGDVTEGAIDNSVRNAITMMATYHFPGTEESAERIIHMLGSNKNVFPVGEPGLDNFLKYKLFNRNETMESLGLNPEKKWVLFTYHPETKVNILDNLKNARTIIDSLLRFDDLQVIITKSNTDLGGRELNSYFDEVTKLYPDQFKLYSSLGQKLYLSLMQQVSFVIGNSSSGIVEAPRLSIPVINIGNRQLGRHICTNIVNVVASMEMICDSINLVLDEEYRYNLKPDFYYGDGMTSEKIVLKLKSIFS